MTTSVPIDAVVPAVTLDGEPALVGLQRETTGCPRTMTSRICVTAGLPSTNDLGNRAGRLPATRSGGAHKIRVGVRSAPVTVPLRPGSRGSLGSTVCPSAG